MHPILFSFNTPEFLQGIFPATITVYTYGTLIALGAILGSAYLARQSKIHLNLSYSTSNNLILIILISAFVGGKFFFFFEDPGYYFGTPANMFKASGKGFVFYGSLILSLTSAMLFFRYHKLNTLKMMDILAITACIVHFFGRLGCFNAGCCYGHPHEGIFSVVFTDPYCMASPLNTPLHPTQLYSAFLIFSIFCVLIWVNKDKRFDGQVFLLYIMLYALGRAIIEIFRGDLARGFIIDDLVSHSQFISALLFSGSCYFYFRLKKQNALAHKTKNMKF